MTGEESCDLCRFWRPYEAAKFKGVGECRRRPPTIQPDMGRLLAAEDSSEATIDDIHVGFWPTTLSMEWCGEFEPK